AGRGGWPGGLGIAPYAWLRYQASQQCTLQARGAAAMADVAADLAERGGRTGSALWRWRPLAYLADALAAEGDRRILWLPVFFATGIALYFTPRVEPPWWLGVAATAAALIPATLFPRRPALCNAAIVLAFCAAALAVMQQARWERGAPMLERRLGPVALTGRVIDVDLLDRGWRVIVAPDPFPGLAASEQPRRVRLPLAPSSDELPTGDRRQVKALP